MLWHWRRRIRRRAGSEMGAFGLSAGVAMDLRLGWDLGLRADQVKAQKRLSDETPHLFILSPHVLGFLSVAGAQHQARRELLEQGKRHLHAVWQNCKSSEVDAFSL